MSSSGLTFILRLKLLPTIRMAKGKHPHSFTISSACSSYERKLIHGRSKKMVVLCLRGVKQQKKGKYVLSIDGFRHY